MQLRKKKPVVTVVERFRGSAEPSIIGFIVGGKAGTGGGKATAGGMSFQSRVAALYSVAILQESEAGPPLGLAAGVTLEYVRCETGEPVDDLLVGTSERGHIFGQAKRTLTLSKATDSALASVADQFVRQFLSNRDQVAPARPWNKRLDPACDRLVLFTGPDTPASIRVALAGVLDAIRGLVTGQPLEDAATNAAEKDALAVFAEHVRAAWKAALGKAPDDAEVRDLLILCHVAVLAVEGDGVDEQAAKDRLRNSIVSDPAQAGAAWDSLTQNATDLAKNRTGADRTALQACLLQAGIALEVPRSFQGDVEALSQWTERSIELLHPLSVFSVKGSFIHLERESSTQLWAHAQDASMLVVGEPGAGKSGTLHDVCELIRSAGHDLVCVLVDRIEARSLPRLNEELGLTHDLVEVLRAWPGTSPGYLVFDALDAARDEYASQMIRDVIGMVRSVPSRWKVIASIRKFDLRYSSQLSTLFPGSGAPGYLDPEFAKVCHLNVPLLSPRELVELASQSPELHALLDAAPGALSQLLRVPFHVRLAAELLTAGLSAGELTPIRTQLELLDRYWQHRVIGEDGRGDGRERVLREVCEQLVARRVLQAERSALSSAGPDLDELLSRNVLLEWQSSAASQPDRYRLSFSHHVLFDYAIARLLLRGTRDALIRRLVDVEDFALVARPSIDLHLRHLWEVDRPQFWELAFALVQDKRVHGLAGLAGPAVIATSASSLADLAPLIDAVRSARPEERDAAVRVLRHVVGALIAGNESFGGPTAGPWCELASALAVDLTVETVGSTKVLVARAIDQAGDLGVSQLGDINLAARALLRFAWSDAPNDHSLAAVAVQAVCRSIEGAPVEAAVILRECLETAHLEDRGYIELPWVARAVASLLKTDVELVVDVYRAAFSFEDTSEETTRMGSSQIVPLASHRRQDYKHVWWQLAEFFPEFLELEPTAAVRALCAVIDAYVDREGRNYQRAEQLAPVTFQLRGRTAEYRVAYSYGWDAGGARHHDEPVRMLAAFDAWIRSRAGEGDGAILQPVLDVLAEHARSAAIWSRVLDAAAAVGGPLVGVGAEMCTSREVLTGLDTMVAAGNFLAAHSAALPAEQRRQIEAAVLAIPDGVEAERLEPAERIRARLLGCLDSASLSDDARRLLDELRTQDAVPPNEPLYRVSEWTSSPRSEFDYLSDLGVPVNEEANQRLLELVTPVSEFSSRFSSSAPTLDDVRSVIPQLVQLHTELIREHPAVHEEVVETGWGHLANACCRIAHCPELECSTAEGARVRDYLVESSGRRRPVFDADRESQFETSPGWGSPAARIDAAAGLMILSQRPDCACETTLATIEALSRDQVSSVRFQIANYLLAIYKSDEELVWQIADRIAHEDPNLSVMRALLGHALGQLAGQHQDRVVELVEVMLDRIAAREATEFRRSAWSLLVRLFVYRNHARSGVLVRERLEQISTSPGTVRSLVGPLRSAVVYGNDGAEHTDARTRAFSLLLEIVRRARTALDEFLAARTSPSWADWSEEERESAKELGSIINDVCTEVYFASGAFDLKPSRQGKADAPSAEVRSRFYREAATLLDELVGVGFVAGAHHIVETLESFIEEDPAGVFVRIAAVVRATVPAGYQFESLAADLVVRVVQRYLADYRYLLRENTECRAALLELLETFVNAGWPSARQLAYRLEEIFR